MSDYGATIKKIRSNKGYTQKAVTGNLFTQSTYSNFESGKSDILMSSFMHLISQFQITTEELNYIHNGYSYDKPTEIIRSFFRLPFNNKSEIRRVINSIDEYFQTGNSNIYLEELRVICEALLIVETSGDFELAKEKVFIVWDRISRFDQWYIMDIKIINVILYFFDSEVAVNITDKLLARLENYKHYEEAVKLTYTITINLSLILIKDKLYKQALDRLNHLLRSCIKEMPYKTLVVCYNRLAICYSNTSNEKEAHVCLDKVRSLLEIYNDDMLRPMLQLEFNKYSIK